MYRNLDPDKVLATIGTLQDRIRERFPNSGLAKVAGELLAVSQEHTARSDAIRRPSWLYRLASILLVVSVFGTLTFVVLRVHPHLEDRWRWLDVIQTLEAALGTLFFLGATLFFLFSLERRAKRNRCLTAIHEMRAMAHIVDMHQLTKSPERLFFAGPDTEHSPKRTLTRFELSRYLDYCSEMLSLMGKLSALYVQGFPDSQAIAAVDEVEDLTTSLANKIWQKMQILELASDDKPSVSDGTESIHEADTDGAEDPTCPS